MALAIPDARTRNKISLIPTKVLPSSIPHKFLPQIILTNVVFVSAVHAGKEWLLDFDVGIFWVIMRVLACGGLGVLVWEGVTGKLTKKKSVEWSVLAMASLLLFVQQACLFTALFRLSSVRVILFTHFSTLWIDAFFGPASAQKILAIGSALLLSIASDTQFSTTNIWRFVPGYSALVLHAVSSSALEHTYSVLSPSVGTPFAVATSTLGASLIALPLYFLRKVLMDFPSTPALPFLSLSIVPLLSFSLLFLSPNTSRSLRHQTSASQYFMVSYPSTCAFAMIVGSLAFSQYTRWSDLLIAPLLYYGMYPQHADVLGVPSRAATSRLMRSYLKTILSNPESRKIFYFLMLNMCYMLVQMLYGVWTNSLGLISDAIHMAFDCMAIGVGLFASVMATWPPNERFTYGYGRIETLSGFANGIFLILISIFIVFEAIQRLLEPPEMNTSQLLLVSSLGLGVNLFGMFAMGGHHHGGHSHSHGHSHSDEGSHSHGAHPSSPLTPHREDRSHSHTPTAPHSHSHSPPPSDTHSHTHSHSQSNSHSHSHPVIEPFHNNHSRSHSRSNSHLHDPSHSHEDRSVPLILKKDGRSFHGPSIKIEGQSDKDGNAVLPIPPHLVGPQDLFSPITPNYRFGHDDHFDTHHVSEHVPNLHDHSHAHDRSHEGHSHNMRGVFLHVMADTLGSVGVIISTLLIQLYGWTGFDPIASLFIAILIAASVIPLVMDTGKILCLDVGDHDASIQEALAELPHIEGVASFTSPRFWPKDDSTLIGSIQIHLAPSASSFDPTGPHSNQRRTYAKLDGVVGRVDTLLRSKISGLEELTIQAEGSNPTFG